MKSFQEAYNTIFSTIKATKQENITLGEALGRILARDIVADADMPPFSRSAMDGFACRRDDVGLGLEILEEIPAGKKPEKKITKGKCAKIMTGAPVPEGADWVVKVEDTTIDHQGRMIVENPGKTSNIRVQGEDLKIGEVIIPKRTEVRSQHIGIMATAGITNPRVFERPSVGILSTGSELVPAERKPGPSQIRNSNGPQLAGQLLNTGITAREYGIVIDKKDIIREKISQAISENDVVLISGGVSAGEYDFVPELLEDLGFTIRMHKMKVRPGKPLLFAEGNEKYIFGVPGNPVSTFVQFEVLIKPFLKAMMGIKEPNKGFYMQMKDDYELKAVTLRKFVPVKMDPEGVFPVEYHGSGHLTAYAEAEGILEIPEEKNYLNKGETVYVRPL